MAVLDDAHTSDEEAAAIAKLKGQVAAIRAGGEIAGADTPLSQPVAFWSSTEAVDPDHEANSLGLPILVLPGPQGIPVDAPDRQRSKSGFHADPHRALKPNHTNNHPRPSNPPDD